MTSNLTPSAMLRMHESAVRPLRESTAKYGRRPELARLSSALMALLVAAPLAFGAVQAWAWGGLALAASALLLWWSAMNVQQGVVTLVWSPLYLPGALFLLVGLFQLATRATLDAIGTREALVKLACDLTFFFLATQCLAASRKLWQRLGLTVTVFTFALALFAIIQFFSDPARIYWSVRPRWPGWIFGPYVNHNHYAGLMEMLIPMACVYGWTHCLTRSARWLAALAVLIAVASVLLSGSRGGSVALGTETCLFFAILLRAATPRDRSKHARSALLGMAGTALLFLWIDTAQMGRHLATIVEAARPHEVVLADRVAVSMDTLRILRDHPWLGTGLGSFGVAYPHYQSLPGDELWDHAHDDYAEALAETGFIGGVTIAIAIAMFIRLAFADLHVRIRNPQTYLQLGATVGCCGMLVHSLCDFNLHIPANGAWFAVCVAWATCGSARAEDGKWGSTPTSSP